MWDLRRRMRPEHLETWFHNLGYFILCIYIYIFFGYVAFERQSLDCLQAEIRIGVSLEVHSRKDNDTI